MVNKRLPILVSNEGVCQADQRLSFSAWSLLNYRKVHNIIEDQYLAQMCLWRILSSDLQVAAAYGVDSKDYVN